MSLISSEAVPDIEGIMPDGCVQSITHYPRRVDTALESAFHYGETYTARKKPVSDETIAILGGAFEQEWAEWQLYQTGGQTNAPTPGSKIVEADGTEWFVKTVQTKQFGKVHNCRSFKEA